MTNNTPNIREQLTRPGGLARQLRTARGTLLAKDLAKRTGWQISKISKIEHGKQLPDEEDLKKWAEHTGATDAQLHEWRALLEAASETRKDYATQTRAGQKALQKQYTGIIAASTLSRLFEPTFIPRFLQLPEYARAVLTESLERHQGDDDVDAAVAERRITVDLLQDPKRQFDLLFTEAALGWCFQALPRDVHLAQLRHLQDVVGQYPNVRIGIIPLFQRISWAPQGSLQIFDNTIGFMEHWLGELHFVLAEDLARLHRVMDKLWEGAREGADALEIISRAIARLESS
jgi:transcriptional regulator with XRE-family HTH domain